MVLAFFQELSRRKVIRVAIAYVVTAWLALQIVDVLNEPLRLPEWFAGAVLTVLLAGLPIVLVLAWAFDITPEGIRRASSEPSGLSTQRRGPLDYVLFGLVAIAIGWLFYRTETEDPALSVEIASRSAPAATVLQNSVAVLPFHNLSPDPNNAYFAAGIHEEILNQLAKIKALAVISRTSVMPYAETDKSVQVIADELNVQTVMEGSVRYAGNKVRITAQLIDAETGAHLWSEAYDRELTDIFGIQSNIAAHITDALKIEFSVAERQAISARTTNNMAAYAEYVRALSYLQNIQSPEPVHAGLDAAIALDPNYADAIATKAWLHGFQIGVNFDGALITAEHQSFHAEQALNYANQAMAIDPNRAGAYMALALVDQYERRWESWFRNAARAFELNPNHYIIQFFYAEALTYQGRIEEALPLFERTIALDPSNWSVSLFFANDLIAEKRWDYAMDQMRQVIALAPNVPHGYIGVANAATFNSNLKLAREMLQRADALPMGPNERRDTAVIYAYLGDESEFARQLDLREAMDPPLNPAERAISLSLQGEIDAAFDSLEFAIATNFPAFIARAMVFRPDLEMFDYLRDDPRFQALVASLPPAP